jgi:hypothetical protein
MLQRTQPLQLLLDLRVQLVRLADRRERRAAAQFDFRQVVAAEAGLASVVQVSDPLGVDPHGLAQRLPSA